MQGILWVQRHALDAKVGALRDAVDAARSAKLRVSFLSEGMALAVPQANASAPEHVQPVRSSQHQNNAAPQGIGDADHFEQARSAAPAALRTEATLQSGSDSSSPLQPLDATSVTTSAGFSPAAAPREMGAAPAPATTHALPPGAARYDDTLPDSADPRLGEYWVSGVDGTFPRLAPERLTHFYSVGKTQPYIGDLMAPGAATQALRRCSYGGEVIVMCSDVGDIWFEFVFSQIMMMRERGYAHVIVYMDAREHCEALQRCAFHSFVRASIRWCASCVGRRMSACWGAPAAARRNGAVREQVHAGRVLRLQHAVLEGSRGRKVLGPGRPPVGHAVAPRRQGAAARLQRAARRQ